MLANGALQLIEIHALLRMRGDLDELHAERSGAAKDSEVRRAFDCDHITGTGHCAKAQVDRLERAARDDNVAGRDCAAHLELPPGDLASQRLGSGRKLIARTVAWLAVNDAAQNQVQA